MKRIWRNVAVLLCAVLLCGCLPQSLGSDKSPATPTDPLTGLPSQSFGQRTVGVVIENSTDSTTQWGISEAAVVLEALTEAGRDTSLCLAYPSVAQVPKVGPVTRGQDLYWRMLVGQQVLPVQRGGGVYNRNYLDYYNLTAVDALEVGRNAFSCGEEWSNTPLWYTGGAALSGVLGRLNVPSKLSASKTAVSSESGETTAPALLPFRTNGRLPDPAAEDAAAVQVHFDAANATGFVYDEDDGVYDMLRADGTPQRDANNGRQVSFDNLLILYSASALRDDGQTLDYDLTVGGGVWLHGGQLYAVTWTQGTDTTFALYDTDGKALYLTPGRSYIALVTSLTGDELTVQDSYGNRLL